jgi:hypothetical protein
MKTEIIKYLLEKDKERTEKRYGPKPLSEKHLSELLPVMLQDIREKYYARQR